MSRIYEALQKAEAERGAEPAPDTAHEDRGFDLDLNRRATPISSGPATFAYEPSLGFAGAEVDAIDQAPPLEHVYSPLSPSGRAPGELPSRVVGLDLENVPQRTWSPNFDRLPALLDRGPAVEQFRSLRSRIYELRDKRPLKTILVTSGMPQEGKSFVSTNLAVSLARNKNARVLLIDGDMRRYTVHQVLGCDAEPGLADFLSGRSSLSEIVQRCDPASSRSVTNGSAVNLPPLALISGGNGGDKAADLSNNNRFEELIHSVAPLFDWIIVDSSPVLPVSDAVNLSRSCDGVLVVARAGITEYEDAQRTLVELKSAHLLGVVLNGTQVPSNRGDYYGYSSVSGSPEVE